jgi:hypothetical protein
MPIKYLEIGWGGSKIQELKFESILLTGESPCWQGNFIFEEERSKIRWPIRDLIE